MSATQKSIVVFGAKGTGKTTNSLAIARHFGLTKVLDEWQPNDAFPETDTLILTNYDPRNVVPILGDRRVISIGDALRVIKKL